MDLTSVLNGSGFTLVCENELCTTVVTNEWGWCERRGECLLCGELSCIRSVFVIATAPYLVPLSDTYHHKHNMNETQDE